MEPPHLTHPDPLTDQQRAGTGGCALPHHECPLCGGPNDCAAACSGDLSTPCWCRGATFAPDLLARIPAADRGRACICAACAAAGA